MPGAKYIVFQNLRPPVAIEETGASPLRSKKAIETFNLGEGNVIDAQGFKISKDHIVQNCTDDGRLLDVKWNNRHHIKPSGFNQKNHKYYRVSQSPN
jgi:hypothetical protein